MQYVVSMYDKQRLTAALTAALHALHCKAWLCYFVGLEVTHDSTSGVSTVQHVTYIICRLALWPTLTDACL